MRAEEPQPLLPEMGPPADPLLDPPLILTEGGTILYAPSGVGKSHTALALAVAMDSGKPMGPLRPRQPTRTLFVNLGRPAASIRHRLYFINAALKLEPQRELEAIASTRGRALAEILPILGHVPNCL